MLSDGAWLCVWFLFWHTDRCRRVRRAQFRALTAAQVGKPSKAGTHMGLSLSAIDIPDDLKCPLCSALFREAVLIPCCGTSFCDACMPTAPAPARIHDSDVPVLTILRRAVETHR